MIARPLQPRRFGAVNWIGFWTLYRREVQRFLKVAAQTVFGPVVTTLLFLAVFAVALGRASLSVDGVPYVAFLAPGLIMMTMAQNAFANTSSSLLIAKVQGNIADILMAPLGPGEMTSAVTLGGITRGLMVGVVVGLVMRIFVPFGMANPAVVLFHALAAASLLALIGILGGLWAQKMDQLAVVTNFVVTPLTFLSGTFYSVEDLPVAFRAAVYLNPFFYMIDGFRYGFIGRADGSPAVGATVMIAVNLVLGMAAYRVVASGWRLKP